MAVNAAVFGAGAFGRNHLRVYRELEREGAAVKLAAIVESNPERAADLRGEWGVLVFGSVEDALAARDRSEVCIDAASVCVPTSSHFEIAAPLLQVGIDLLVEKPISATTEQADALIELAHQHGRIVQAGHLERFNPAILAVQPLLNRPMFFEAHRLSIFTPRALDVDVVLDLMIHDLDIVLSFVQSPVREIRAVGLPVLSNKIDIANVRVEFESGCVANFTASRVSTEQVRKLRFFQPREYVSVDYARRDVLVIDVNGIPGAAAAGAEAPSYPQLSAARLKPCPDTKQQPPAISSTAAAGAEAGLDFKKPRVRQAEPLRLEVESFLDAVRTRSAPVVSAEDGRAALALALEINRAIGEHARRAGIGGF